MICPYADLDKLGRKGGRSKLGNKRGEFSASKTLLVSDEAVEDRLSSQGGVS